jgi:CheY-like chemotaxis protein
MESLVLTLGTEVRQGMHNMIGLMELAAAEPLTERQAQYLSRAREGADRLVRRVNDMAELGRPSTMVNAGPFAVREALAEIADLMGALAGLKGLTFDWIVYPTVRTCITADKMLLQDIAHRLIGNAIRFTETGGIRLLATMPHIAEEPPSLVLEVTDSGPGIPSEVLARLRSPAEGHCWPGLGLTGLSLRLVQKRLADLGGRMSISSQFEGRNPDGGTTVRVSLPVSLAGSPAWTEEVGETAAAGGLPPRRLKLLIAEDSDDSFMLFQVYTQEAGHDVTRAHDGVEAVDLAKDGNHDLIVMDASMPGMDGYTATRLIREWETVEGRARRPIVMLSADDLERQRRMGGAVGCSGYLSKPADREQLLRALAYYSGAGPNAAHLRNERISAVDQEGRSLLV